MLRLYGLLSNRCTRLPIFWKSMSLFLHTLNLQAQNEFAVRLINYWNISDMLILFTKLSVIAFPKVFSGNCFYKKIIQAKSNHGMKAVVSICLCLWKLTCSNGKLKFLQGSDPGNLSGIGWS